MKKIILIDKRNINFTSEAIAEIKYWGYGFCAHWQQ